MLVRHGHGHSARPDGRSRSRLQSSRRVLEDAISQLDSSPVPWTRSVADHARTVVVPLANPDTATDLLRVARALLSDEGGRLIGLVVLLDDADAEKSRELSGGMRELVEVVGDRLSGATVEFRTRTAISVARGILDVIRDAGADTVVLGIRPQDEDGEARLGSIAESVIDAAACDVVVYRPHPARGLDEVERVLVAVDGGRASRDAVRVGTFLRGGLRAALELVHVQDPRASTRQGHAVIARSMADLVAGREATLRVVRAEEVVDGLRDAIDDHDLVILGFDHAERATQLQNGAVGRDLLEAVDAPVITVARLARSHNGLQDRWRRVVAWMTPRLTDVEQETMRSYAEDAAEAQFDYLAMTALSGLIAAFGLLLDSAAVIIGAMLVAPLMQPLIAFGIGVVAGRPRLALRALTTVLIGTGLVMGMSILSGLVVGVAVPTDAILSRGSPSLLDATVALAAGTAGAYATARKDIPAALAGVAIAAALVPPIGAAGLAIAAGRGALAGGASLLFAVNIACIAVVSAVVFQWLGLRPADDHRTPVGQVALAVASVGTLVALVALLIVGDARRVRIDERPIEARLAEAGYDVDVAEITVLEDQSPTVVRIVVDVLDLAPAERGPLATLLAAEVGAQVGEDARTRLVLRDVLVAD